MQTAVVSHRWLGLIAASGGMFLGAVDITVNVALPEITGYFGTDLETVRWIIIAYLGSTTGLQLTLGSGADRYGLKRFYLLGLAAYTAAVLLIGLAPSLAAVVGLRVLQAVGNGLILATAPALVSGLFPPEERGRALGIMGAIGTLGMLTGALGGGLLVEAFGWQSIFLGRLPFCAVIALLAVVTLRADPVRRDARGFDVPGAVTLFAGLMALVLFASLGAQHGWTNPKLLALLAVGVVSLAVFVRIETRAASPVLDLALVRDRMVSLPVATAFLMNFATFVNLFILPFFVSDVIAGGALALGIVLMLNPAVGTLSSPAGGWLSDRISPAYVCTAALCLMGASLLWTAMLDEGASVLDVSLRVGLMGLGMGAFQAASSTLIMNRVPQEQHGAGASILSLGRSMGTVSSVALMAAFFAWRLAAQGAASSPSEVAGVVSPEYAGAFVAAFRQTYLVAAALMGVGVALSVAYWPRFTSSRV